MSNPRLSGISIVLITFSAHFVKEKHCRQQWSTYITVKYPSDLRKEKGGFIGFVNALIAGPQPLEIIMNFRGYYKEILNIFDIPHGQEQNGMHF